MDAFEELVASILQSQGFWVRTSVKVELTGDEKKAINRPSSPRWELDIVAYRPSDNIIWVVECKSYLDSYGVKAAAFSTPGHSGAKKYKLFTERTTRDVVFKALCRQLRVKGSIHGRPRIHLCLAAGRIAPQSEKPLREHFAKKKWGLLGRDWLEEQLAALADTDYQNDVATMTVKLLRRRLGNASSRKTSTS
jgi:hypothetical protein